MVTFTCPYCGQERTGVRRRCYECTKSYQTPEGIERTRAANIGRKQSEEHRRKNSEGHKGNVNRFDLAAYTKGKRPHNYKPVGTTRKDNGHTKVKCEDGKWRYRARLTWVEHNGYIPEGMLIHHINEDPHDDRIENLQLVTRKEHIRIHKPKLGYTMG